MTYYNIYYMTYNIYIYIYIYYAYICVCINWSPIPPLLKPDRRPCLYRRVYKCFHNKNTSTDASQFLCLPVRVL